MTVFLNFTSIN